MDLITREALALYLATLAPGGVIAWPVSNRNLDLAPIIADLAGDARVVAWPQIDQPLRADSRPSDWIAIARHPGDLEPLASDPPWRRLRGRPDARPWTNEFSNILSALRWRLAR